VVEIDQVTWEKILDLINEYGQDLYLEGYNKRSDEVLQFRDELIKKFRVCIER